MESRKYCQVEIKDLPNGLGNDKHPNIKMGQEYRKFRKNIWGIEYIKTWSTSVVMKEMGGGDSWAIILY